jgi:hypothetical protein
MIRIGFIVILLFVVLVSAGQNSTDAIRYGLRDISGSARYVGLSGAMGAMGAEFSAIRNNPGGLGMFRRGTLSGSILYGNQTFDALHYNESTSTRHDDGRISSLGVVLSGPLDEGDWKQANLVFGYENERNLDADIRISGVNPESSRLDVYMNDIINEPGLFLEDIEAFFPFGAGLAWGAQLIDTLSGQYFHYNENYGEQQSRNTTQRGGLGTYYFGFGANYMDRWYVGGTIGFTSLRYTYKSTYREELNDPLSPLESWSQYEEIRTSGSGFNIDLGVLYQVHPNIRIGAAFASPEWFNLAEQYRSDVDAEWKDGSTTFARSPDGVNEYRYKSPYRFTLSAAFTKRKLGSLSADLEIVDYSSMRYKAMSAFPIDFTGANQDIVNTFRQAANLKVGAEVLYGPLYFRGGFALIGNPYRSENDASATNYSFGIGCRVKRFVADFAYMQTRSGNVSTPIHFTTDTSLRPTEVQRRLDQVVLTIGVRFVDYDQ